MSNALKKIIRRQSPQFPIHIGFLCWRPTFLYRYQKVLADGSHLLALFHPLRHIVPLYGLEVNCSRPKSSIDDAEQSLPTFLNVKLDLRCQGIDDY